ncbi:hypothetical protein DICPUDRAFT_50727 [Dictyostelium purpureum]|uniref:Uncharacterized protein n=1 Tax=Dictyostelium purpureum TaxID=5786 RepID=F0ZZZ5_DICPU|nr:uncharacterized protein DICPUDRAFT_50727 [Dictyostelium purpureum]EGC30482.1 hypothetical protein DICPUDRAFT_50727 [Dictyostelium purpureum]|eukprot:XP_003292984.1 hypothetical protein DICPUDRAFT_50727 [Dictyostelium purpureum]
MKIKNLFDKEFFPLFSFGCIYFAQILYGWSLEGKKDVQWIHEHLGVFGVYILFSTILFVSGFSSLGKIIYNLTETINSNNNYKKYDFYNTNSNSVFGTNSILKKYNISLNSYRNLLLFLFTAGLVSSLLKVTSDTDTSLIHHGQYNLIAFSAILIVYLFGFLFWWILLKYWTLKKIAIRFTLFFIGLYILFQSRNAFILKDWPNGFGGRKLMYKDENNSKVCKIDDSFIVWPAFQPKGSTWIVAGSQECPKDTFSKLENGILTMDGCKEDFKQYTVSPTFWDDLKHFGTFTSDFAVFENQYKDKTASFEFKGPVKITHETVMATCGNKTEILFHNVRDDSVHERVKGNFNSPKVHPEKVKIATPAKDEKEREKPIDILFLMIDALSRAHFKRALPTTYETLQEIQKQGHSKIFQFFRYHSLKPFSDPNTMAMYNGLNRVGYDEIDYKNGINAGDRSEFSWEKNPMFYQSFRNDTYVNTWITGLCQDWYQRYLEVDKPEGSVDHELALPFCSPHLHPAERPFGVFDGPYSIRRRCLGEKHVHERIFDYINQYWDNYKDVGKIATATLMDAHEGTMEVIGIMDKQFQKFIDKDMRPRLNDTALFLVSDHGSHMGAYYVFSKGGKIEVAMPLLYIVLPTWFTDKYPEVEQKLLENENQLATPFQLYDTFRALSRYPEFGGIDASDPDGKREEKGLLGDIKDDITCNELGIPHDFCQCH